MKNILIAATGLSPQVITETLFALHQNQKTVDAIHVITTQDGKEMIHATLLSGKKGRYNQYLKEYGINPSSIDFSYRNIHVICNEHDIEISDIASEADNERFLKRCLELTFAFTSRSDTAAFFSVAGGRKTMSSCLTLAAQIYGRPQDRLYHVLVSPEFESSRDFYYPPKKSKTIELRDYRGNPFFKETKYAAVNLIHIPFFSIRDQLPDNLLKKPIHPGTLMLSLIREETYSLKVNLISKKIIYKTIELDLMPARMALYAFFILQKKNCTKKVDTCGNCTECYLDIQSIYEKQDKITDLYKKIIGTQPLEEMSETGITNLNAGNFNMYKGKIKKDILSRFGPYALKDLKISPVGKRPNTRYGISMDRDKIELIL
jgi:CRISPR-associated protein (TIGR02584 family)